MVHVNTVLSQSSNPRPKSTPRLGLFVYLIAFCAVIGGFLFGYDTGIVSSALLYVPKHSKMKPMGKLWQQIIVAVTPGFAALGSLIAGKCADKYGRRKVIIASSFVFTIGGVLFGIAVEKFMLLCGRILLGLAIGTSSMIVPMYIGETSPSHIRGQLITAFQLMITFGLLAANILAGGFSYIDPVNVGWRLMVGVSSIPSAIQFIIFFCLPESPRWLYKHERFDEAEKVLNKVYSHNQQWVKYELSEIDILHKGEKETCMSETSVLKRIFTTPHVRKALLVGCLVHAFQQLSGINTIMYYTGKIIQSSGVGNEHTIIWISVAISAVNFLCTFIPMYLIDRVGRRALLIVSVLGVAITLLLMAASFYAINIDSAMTIAPNFPLEGAPNRCFTYSNCDNCVTEEYCGFCQFEEHKGYCLPISESTGKSSIGPCRFNTTKTAYTPDYQWSADFCVSRFTVLPIGLMVVYLSFFSTGYAPLPWVINAEFYPLWARSTCISMATAVNWVFNLVISLTFLSLTEAATKHGTFLMYGIITLIALFFVTLAVPETRNYSIEEVEILFMTRKQRREQTELLNVIDRKKNNIDISLQY